MLKLVFVSLIGFSVIAAAVLIVVYSLLYKHLNKSWLSIVSASALLIAFAGIQLMHLHFIDASEILFKNKVYSTLILATAPLYLLFVIEYIGGKIEFKPIHLLHTLPLLANAILPNRWSLPIGFLVGTAYAIYCVYQLQLLRGQRKRYQFEYIGLTFFVFVAGVLFILGVSTQFVGTDQFTTIYGLLVAFGFLVVVTALLLVPDIAVNINEALETRYAKSTLAGKNPESMLKELDHLLIDEGLSRNEGLNLTMLAEISGYSSHQISELINSQLGYGFSQYVRQHRVEAAKQMLIDEPTASVLSVGLSVGFSSQSTFYAAFSQLVGQSPGKYRQQHADTGSSIS